MPLPTFQFDGYTLRPAAAEDADLARAWVEADPEHAGWLSSEFWLQNGRGLECYVLEDAAGPVFFFRMEQVVRGHVQFGPASSGDERDRTMTALVAGMHWLGLALGAMGKHEMIFDSKSPALMRFCEKRLGFAKTPDMLTKRLPVRT